MATGLRAAMLALVLFLSLPALAETYTGKVVAITDGDTFVLLTADKRQLKVRLAEIDTPERGQPYGNRARQALSDLAFDRQARAVVEGYDRWSRAVARVFIGETDLNAALVRQGAAWAYRGFVPAILRCLRWRTKRERPSAACGRCPKRRGHGLGNGGRPGGQPSRSPPQPSM